MCGKASARITPEFTAPTFSGNAIGLIAPVAVILVAENTGHVKAVAAMTGSSLDKYLGELSLAMVWQPLSLASVVVQVLPPTLRHSPFIDARHLDEITAEIARLLDIPLPHSNPPVLV